MRLLQQLELSGSIAGRITPRVRRPTYEGTYRRLAVTKVDEIHRDDLINDAGKLTRGLLTFDLDRPLRALKFVEDLFEDANEDHVLAARVLELCQPGDHFSRVQAVGAADVLLAGALAESFWLLL